MKILLVGIFLVGCSSFKKNPKIALTLPDDFTQYDKIDYEKQLLKFESLINVNHGNEIRKFQPPADNYLKKIAEGIFSKNEVFLNEKNNFNFYLIKIDQPVHFSLPRGKIYLSSGLIKKYIKHESILASILAYEILRSDKLIYGKNIFIPTGYINFERLVGLTRLRVEDKIQLHKWSYNLIKRCGYDGEYYLSWLQIQNRNSADFLFLSGDVSQVNREESMFKKFLIQNLTEETSVKKNSSKEFYKFLNYI